MATEREPIWRTTTIALVTSLITVLATQAVQAVRDDRTWRREHRLQELQSQIAKAREAMDLTDSITRQGASLTQGMKHDFDVINEWNRAARRAAKTGKWNPPRESPANSVAQMILRLDTDVPKLAKLLHEVWITDQVEEPFKACGDWQRTLDQLTGAYWAVLDPKSHGANVSHTATTPDEAQKKFREAVVAEAAARKHLQSEVDAVWDRMLLRLHNFPNEVRFAEKSSSAAAQPDAGKG